MKKQIVNPKPVVNSGQAVISSKRFDGWQNVFSGLGMSGFDKRVSGTWNYDRMVEIDVETAYASDDIAAKLIDKLPDTAMQKGLAYQGLSDDQEVAWLKKLKDLQMRSKFIIFKKWGRLYGGAALLIGTDEDDDLTKPLRPTLVNNVTSLTLISRYELYPSQVQYNPLESNFGFPEFYRLQLRGTSPVNGHEVHHSRILRTDGVLLPRRLHIQNQYWGDSVLSRLQNVIRNHGTSHDSIATVMQDFRVAVMKIKNLADMLANGDDQLITQRLAIVNLAKSVARAVVIDTEEEDFQFSTANLTGIKDLIEAVNERLSSAFDMPATVLFGRSPVGLGGSGGHEQDNWYDCVANFQETECRPPLDRLFEIIMSTKQGPTQGIIPPKFGFTFVPLKQTTDEERADVRLKTAQADNFYYQMQALTADEIALSRFGSGTFDMETKINSGTRVPIDNGEEEQQPSLINPDINELGQITPRGGHFATLQAATVNDEDDDLVRQAKIELQKAQAKYRKAPTRKWLNRLNKAMVALRDAEAKMDEDSPGSSGLQTAFFKALEDLEAARQAFTAEPSPDNDTKYRAAQEAHIKASQDLRALQESVLPKGRTDGIPDKFFAGDRNKAFNGMLENQGNYDRENTLLAQKKLNEGSPLRESFNKGNTEPYAPENQTAVAAKTNYAPERTSKETSPTVSAVEPLNLYDSADKKRPAQTIIISKSVAKTAAEAHKLAAKYGKAGEVDETSQSFRYRQRAPEDFAEGSMRTWENPNDKGVKIVFGALKGGDAKKNDSLYERWDQLFNMSIYKFIKGSGHVDTKRLDEREMELSLRQSDLVSLREKLKSEWNADDWRLAAKQVRAIERIIKNKEISPDKMMALQALGHQPTKEV